MVKARKVVSRVIGGIQCGLGAIASVSSFLVYASPTIRDILDVNSEEVPLYVFLFLVFGIISMLSGLLLLREEKW